MPIQCIVMNEARNIKVILLFYCNIFNLLILHLFEKLLSSFVLCAMHFILDFLNPTISSLITTIVTKSKIFHLFIIV